MNLKRESCRDKRQRHGNEQGSGEVKIVSLLADSEYMLKDVIRTDEMIDRWHMP